MRMKTCHSVTIHSGVLEKHAAAQLLRVPNKGLWIRTCAQGTFKLYIFRDYKEYQRVSIWARRHFADLHSSSKPFEASGDEGYSDQWW